MKRILLARIVGAQGIRGEVKVQTFTGDPAAVGDYGPLTDARGDRKFALKVVRPSRSGVVARISGVADRNAAEALVGTELYVERSRLPPPLEGEYYHADLIGLTAVGSDGAVIGRVVAVQNFGAGDLLEIGMEGRRDTDLVPFKDEFVPVVDIVGGRVVVVMPSMAEDEPDEDQAAGEPRSSGDEATDQESKA